MHHCSMQKASSHVLRASMAKAGVQDLYGDKARIQDSAKGGIPKWSIPKLLLPKTA